MCGQLGALNANEYEGRVNVNRNEPDNLAYAYDNHGGRLAEVQYGEQSTPTLVGVLCSYGSMPSFFRVVLRQLPSIRPISCNCCWRTR